MTNKVTYSLENKVANLIPVLVLINFEYLKLSETVWLRAFNPVFR